MKRFFSPGMWLCVWLVCESAAVVFGQTAPIPELLDPMENTAGWTVYKDDRGVSVSLDTIDADKGKAVEVFYSMEGGEWFGIFKSINRDLSGYKGVRFSVMGAGSANSLEFKLEDADGTMFGKVVGLKSNTGSWAKVSVMFDQLAYWWGGDNSLDWTKIKNIHFAVSKKVKGDQGGSGKLMIDQVELLK